MAPDVHAHRLIPAYRLGLLEPAPALEVREHLRSCDDCRSAFEPFRDLSAEEELRPGHLPIALLTRWDAFEPLLTEDERTCLEAHFEACARCREGRAFARHLTELPETHAEPSRRAWFGFGTAAMAAVLAVAAIVLLRERPAPPSARRTPAPLAMAVPAPKAPALRAPAVSLGGDARGGVARIVRVPKGATDLPLRVPPLLGVGPDARIDIRVEGPGGVEFGRAEFPHRTLFGSGVAPALDAHAPRGALPEGHYTVTVTSDAPAPGGFEGATYGFDLRLE